MIFICALRLSGGGILVMNVQKEFIKPTCEVIDFVFDDIITFSTRDVGGDDWNQYPDTEDWNS